MKPKNDVKWRTLDDEGYAALKKYPDNMVIVQTDVAYRIEWSSSINPMNGWLECAGENVIRFAFIN
jgi:hypothetical protein